MQSSAALPLSRFPVVGTHSLEEARDAVTRVYLAHDLTADHDRVDMTLNAVADHHLTLGYLTYQAAAELTMPPTEDCYHVNLTTAGSTDADRSDGARARTEARRSGAVLNPLQRNTVRWSADAEQLILKIPRSSLESHLGDLVGRSVAEVLDFDFGLDLTHAAGQSLLNSVEFLARELDRPGGLADMPLAREQLEAFVMTQVLLAVPHEHSAQLATPTAPAQRTRVGAVVELIDAHPDQPLTLVDMTRVAGVGARALQAGFRETVGMAPLAYLRKVRLDRVRAELTETAGDRSVTDVALRWGFAHLGRFAGQYRAQFGESPSETVRTALRTHR